jgi:hypothetical protein
VRSRSYGAVVLWIVQREWQAHGSLERHLARELSRQRIDYNGLTKDEKLKRLSGAFPRRQQQLTNLRKRFGESIALVLSELKNTAQFVRTRSVLRETRKMTRSRITSDADWP